MINLYVSIGLVIGGCLLAGLAVLLWKWKPVETASVDQTSRAPTDAPRHLGTVPDASTGRSSIGEFPVQLQVEKADHVIAAFIIEKRGGKAYVDSLIDREAKLAEAQESKPN